MRNYSPLLAALFNATTHAVLAATVLNPEKAWYLSNLAAHLGVGPSSLQRTLAQLTHAGILHRSNDGNRVYYRADPACPILPELAAILAKTTGVVEPPHAAPAPRPGKAPPADAPIQNLPDNAPWLL